VLHPDSGNQGADFTNSGVPLDTNLPNAIEFRARKDTHQSRSAWYDKKAAASGKIILKILSILSAYSQRLPTKTNSIKQKPPSVSSDGGREQLQGINAMIRVEYGPEMEIFHRVGIEMALLIRVGEGRGRRLFGIAGRIGLEIPSW
jgi:hypothetical protein